MFPSNVMFHTALWAAARPAKSSNAPKVFMSIDSSDSL
jgi:hypothetical protein